MRKTNVLGIIIILLSITLITACTHKPESLSEPLRVGWMTTWTEGGLTAEVLKRTDLLERNDVNAEMVPFLYGPPMVEGALSNQIDALFIGWVPAVNLLSKSDDWIIVSKLAYFPLALMARNNSGIENVGDLRGKKVAVPYATGPYPLVINSLRTAGLEAGKDYTLLNLKPADLGIALERKEIDAAAWGEPSITLFKQKNLAYSIENYSDISFVVVSKTYADNNPEELRNFLKAIKQSQLYISQNKNQVLEWFAEDASFDLSLVNATTFIEPNYYAKELSDIDLTISQQDITETQKKIDFEYEIGILSQKLVLKEEINQSYLN